MDSKRATILNVDDDDVARYTTTRLLQSAGFDVIEAENGHEALKKAAEQQPDLVILDVQLPDVNGYDVCRQLKAKPETRNITVLHLSASFINSQDKAFGLEGGADGYLTQPVEPPVLIGHIKALIRMREAEHTARDKAIQWQTTFDAINDAIFLVDRQGCILQCNQAMLDLIGKPAGLIQGWLLDDLSRSDPSFALPAATHIASRQTDEVRIRDKWYLSTIDAIQTDGSDGGVVYALTDITARKLAEEENIRLLHETRDAALQQRTFMRDVLSSVTDGKLTLCDTESDLPSPPPRHGETVNLALSDLSKLRVHVRDVMTKLGFPEDRINDTVIAVHEAGSNAVVHAGGGKISIYHDSRNSKVQFWVRDQGFGIAVETLPRAALQRGFTTVGTFGHGFKIMIEAADHVWLLTGTSGTTVVIEKSHDDDHSS